MLLVVANFLPWALGRLCRRRWAAPLDLGFKLPDGRRLLGDHKTWRGFGVAVVGTALLAAATQLSWWRGAEFAALSMSGDSLSSAWKRYRGYVPGRETFAIDQLPEALFPLIVLRESLNLSWTQVVMVTAAFMLLDILSMRLRHPGRGSSTISRDPHSQQPP